LILPSLTSGIVIVLCCILCLLRTSSFVYLCNDLSHQLWNFGAKLHGSISFYVGYVLFMVVFFVMFEMNNVKVAVRLFNDIQQFKYNLSYEINISFTKSILDQQVYNMKKKWWICRSLLHIVLLKDSDLCMKTND